MPLEFHHLTMELRKLQTQLFTETENSRTAHFFYTTLQASHWTRTPYPKHSNEALKNILF